METIMILGAAYAQLPLYRAAKRMGYRTCAVSIEGNYPCFEIADECAYVNITDIPAVIHAAEKVRPIAAASCGFDLMMKTIGPVCDALQIPGPSAESALKASNKRFMKEAFRDAGVKTAAFHIVKDEDELENALAQMNYPLMVKAVDQNGSKGVFRCDDHEKAVSAFREAIAITSVDYLIVEEYISGPLFGVEAMIQNGEIVFMLPNESEVFRGATDIPIGHSVPFSDTASIPLIKETVEQGIRALGLDNTPVNTDLIMHNGIPYIVEMTGRAGANGLSEVTGAYFGVDYYEMILRLALGEDVRPYFSGKEHKACISHSIRSDHAGILKTIENRNLPDQAVLELGFNAEEGDEVRIFDNCRDRIGSLIVTGNDREDCRKRLESVLSNISILLEESDHAGIHRYSVL